MKTLGARERARELIAQFGFEDRMEHVPAELSIGERQRTALARALFNRPRLLLVDEPTGNLDEKNAEIVIQTLIQFAENGGAVLLVTHDQSALENARRVFRLEGGQLTESRNSGK